MDKNDKKYLVALSHFPKFGSRRLLRLKNFFGDFAGAWQASTQKLKQAGIGENIAQEFNSARITIDPDRLMDQLKNEQIQITEPTADIYPKLLKEIYDPPAILYYQGELNGQEEFAISIVGTRKSSSYGQRATQAIAGGLARNQLTIVSGLALGIDTLAHQAALDAGGRTVAVLGTGIDKKSIYPFANRHLADKIIQSGGAVVSEFPLGTQPLRFNFPMRNRIISGWSLGTLVVEAGEKSGALITAQSSLDQNREVFAVPGNIYSLVSIGPNSLIKQGAKAVTEAEEILEALDLMAINTYIDNKKIMPESEEEKLVLAQLGADPLHVNDLIRLTNLRASLINSTLTIMEMKGMIKNVGSMQYVLAR